MKKVLILSYLLFLFLTACDKYTYQEKDTEKGKELKAIDFSQTDVAFESEKSTCSPFVSVVSQQQASSMTYPEFSF